MKKINILKNVDEFVGEKVELATSHPDIQKALDSYSMAEEKTQEIVKASIFASLIVVPLIALIVIYSFSNSMNSQLAMKEAIISKANEIIQKKSLLETEKREIFGRTPIATQSSLQNHVASIARTSSVNMGSIKISKFSKDEIGADLLQVKANINFSSLSNKDFFTFTKNISGRGRMAIDEVNVEKSKNDNLLKGFLTIIYTSKEQTND